MPGIGVREMLAGRIREAVPAVSALYLFGSRARGDAADDSDWDLALLLPRGLGVPPSTLPALQGDLESLVGRPVDISVLDPDRSLIHAKEVIANGVALFSTDEEARLAFEAQVLSAYARFCEDRAPVIESYSAEARHG